MFSVSEIRPRPSSKQQKGRILLKDALNYFSSELRLFSGFKHKNKKYISGNI
jgi:hypothetical protein